MPLLRRDQMSLRVVCFSLRCGQAFPKQRKFPGTQLSFQPFIGIIVLEVVLEVLSLLLVTHGRHECKSNQQLLILINSKYYVICNVRLVKQS